MNSINFLKIRVFSFNLNKGLYIKYFLWKNQFLSFKEKYFYKLFFYSSLRLFKSLYKKEFKICKKDKGI